MRGPNSQHLELRGRLQALAESAPMPTVPAADLIVLLDYITELETEVYCAWENSMGDDL